ESEVIGRVAAPGLRLEKAEHPESDVARFERQQHRRSQLKVADHAQVLCVASTAHEHLVGHLGKEHRLSGPQDLVDARRRARIWWIPAAQLSGKVDLRRI